MKETLIGTGREGGLELRGRKAKKNRLVIISALIVTIIGVSIYFAMFAGNGSSTQNNGPIEATWIEPQVVGDSVSIPVSEVENNRNIRFKVETQTGDMSFMAYILNAQVYVRASVCPPCRGMSYALDQDILVCDTCATTFRATTGEGIRGACVGYPKSAVTHEINDGSIVMKTADLRVAYEDTLEPGWP